MTANRILSQYMHGAGGYMSQINEKTVHIDELATRDMAALFNQEDKLVAWAVEKSLDTIAQAIDRIAVCLAAQGRLFYIGSGSGGKIGVLDATECPPTFGVNDGVVIGVISGGAEALTGWREDTEDDGELARCDLKEREFSRNDILIALSASGNTPYVLAAVDYAKKLGAQTIGVCCNPGGLLESSTDLCITVDVGPEVIMGSTRLKAGTAQKMVLNMLSSCAMIKLGKTYGNLMVDVRPINLKLKKRVIDVVQIATGKTREAVMATLEAAEGDAKAAIVMLLLDVAAPKARDLLKAHNGFVKKAVREYDESNC